MAGKDILLGSAGRGTVIYNLRKISAPATEGGDHAPDRTQTTEANAVATEAKPQAAKNADTRKTKTENTPKTRKRRSTKRADIDHPQIPIHDYHYHH